MFKKFLCFMRGYHKWISKERFYSENGVSGVPQYKIVCSDCEKGEKDEWEDNSIIFIVKD